MRPHITALRKPHFTNFTCVIFFTRVRLLMSLEITSRRKVSIALVTDVRSLSRVHPSDVTLETATVCKLSEARITNVGLLTGMRAHMLL